MSDLPLQSSTPQAQPAQSDDRTTISAPTPLANSLVNTVATVSVKQPEPQTPSFKENKVFAGSEVKTTVETTVGEDAIEKEPLPEAVESWMEKVGQSEQTALPKVQLPKAEPVQPVVDTQAPATVYILPLGEMELKKAKHANVNDSIRWLATWCVRLLKKLGSEAAYKEG
ncbi:hypothetical protein C5B42_00210 [Candidatus Cerribacteria bacterium 'Amazon FNV 2010 28 9']|uniref:Uncharacterized protein n=1 Tax=Candidatus Cerribacteria bacterium 'Amazon FNV 2010 28 9' TaxID=2081795 RepID=A0A317JRP3_9BACT|nr:MAG: hypothetical protein C5B42_00210 [Candidatus Cerribacteria bacterium 'Amazon FNV 2010 28 9']